MNMSLLAISTAGIVFLSLAGALLLGVALFILIIPFKPWLVALLSGCYILSFKLLSARSRKIDVMALVEAYIQSKKSKFGFSFNELEAYHLSGGNCQQLIAGLYTAKNSNIPLEVETAKSIDLSGLNLKHIIESAINSHNIMIENISALTQDSFEIIACVKATIKTNIKNALNGSDEQSLKDKISSFVISKIALSSNYKNLLSNPQTIIEDYQKAKLDDGNLFRLISLEIAKVDIGRDVGTEMAIKRAEKEKAYMQVSAEREKNQEELRQLQMKTQVEEMKGEVLSAEAEVPKAIADAIKEGRFSIMDYYKLMNLQADTALRRSILSDEKAKKSKEG